MSLRRPVSRRLLKHDLTLAPKTGTGDGAGGKTLSFSAGDEVTVRGTEPHISTEEFPDVSGDQLADRGLYVCWVDPTNGTPNPEDRLRFDGVTYEIFRTSHQNGLYRLVMREVR